MNESQNVPMGWIIASPLIRWDGTGCDELRRDGADRPMQSGAGSKVVAI